MTGRVRDINTAGSIVAALRGESQVTVSGFEQKSIAATMWMHLLMRCVAGTLAPMRAPIVPLVRVMLSILAGVFFLSGIDWGLPSRAVDPFLFGPTRQPWTGSQIAKLGGTDDADNVDRGADVAAHPLLDRSQPVVVNATDIDRARIVRRYRLYSNQPDEMITFRALAGMRPGRGDFDPRFFQYGGAWVYPVGAMLKVASLTGFVQLRGDVAFYLDHPAAFGRYYVVARVYSAAWGILGVLLMFELTRQWTRSTAAGALAGVLYCTLPVMVNAAHEAKPHLAGGVLVLAALWTATRYILSRRRRWAWFAAVAAGAAASMVWTGAAAIAVLPVMAYIAPPARRGWVRFTLALVAVSVAFFVLLNPYLPIDLLFHRGVVSSNVGNSAAMYHAQLRWQTIVRAAWLLGLAMGPIVATAAVAATVCVALKVVRSGVSLSHPAWLAVGPAVLVAGQFVLLASGKPAEYARFSLTLDLLLTIALAATCASLRMPALRRATTAGLMAISIGAGIMYVHHFRHDRGSTSTRLHVARLIAGRPGPVYVHAEPAPYCLPPVNVFDRPIVLLPDHTAAPPTPAGVDVSALDVRPSSNTAARVRSWLGWSTDAPITWANKPFAVRFNDP